MRIFRIKPMQRTKDACTKIEEVDINLVNNKIINAITDYQR